MKTVLFCLACLLATLFSTKASESRTSETQNFRIEKIDATNFKILYPNGQKPVMVTIESNKGITCFTVNCFPVKAVYQQSKYGFGLRMNGEVKKEVKMRGIENAYNLKQLHLQSILCEKKIDTSTSIKLIATYFPDLIKEKQQVALLFPQK